MNTSTITMSRDTDWHSHVYNPFNLRHGSAIVDTISNCVVNFAITAKINT